MNTTIFISLLAATAKAAINNWVDDKYLGGDEAF